MTYSLVCNDGTSQTTTDHLEAERAVRLMRQWPAGGREAYLVLRDDRGLPVAFRGPADTSPSWAPMR